MISYGSGGCGGCVRYIQRAEQPLYEPGAEDRPKAEAVGKKAPCRDMRRPVVCVEEGRTFASVREAGSWVFARGLSVSVKAAASAISRCASSCGAAYGFHWSRPGAARPAGRARPHRVAVLCVEEGELFASAADAGRWAVRCGRTASNAESAAAAVSAAASGRLKTAHGLHWRRVEGKEAMANG